MLHILIGTMIGAPLGFAVACMCLIARKEDDQMGINSQWVLCSERMPEEDGEYLVYDSEEYYVIDTYYTKDGNNEEFGFKTFKGWQSCLQVAAWMPIPQLPWKRSWE